MTVCRLLESLPKQCGKIVSVIRGELRTGPGEIALYGHKCSHHLVTDGHAWLDAVWLTPPGGLGNRPVNFKLDKKALEAAKEAIKRERDAGKKGKIMVTFTGMCEAHKMLFGGRGPNGDWIGNGFGHLNAYPAQLIYSAPGKVAVE